MTVKANLIRFGRGRRLLRQQEIRLVDPPAITKTEINRRGLAAEPLGHLRLVVLGEDSDRPEIAAERLELPLAAVEILDRDAGVVLQDRRAVGQHEIANRGATAAVRQIR